MIIRYPNGDRDEGQWETTMNVTGDKAFGLQTRSAAERISRGSRYGYAGRYRILLGPGEPNVAQSEVKPVVLSRAAGQCGNCSPGTKVVRLVVTVDPDGHVRWPRPDPERHETFEAEELSAAQRAALRWVYKPAISRGRPVASWAIAEVEVHGPDR